MNRDFTFTDAVYNQAAKILCTEEDDNIEWQVAEIVANIDCPDDPISHIEGVQPCEAHEHITVYEFIELLPYPKVRHISTIKDLGTMFDYSKGYEGVEHFEIGGDRTWTVVFKNGYFFGLSETDSDVFIQKLNTPREKWSEELCKEIRNARHLQPYEEVNETEAFMVNPDGLVTIVHDSITPSKPSSEKDLDDALRVLNGMMTNKKFKINKDFNLVPHRERLRDIYVYLDDDNYVMVDEHDVITTVESHTGEPLPVVAKCRLVSILDLERVNKQAYNRYLYGVEIECKKLKE